MRAHLENTRLLALLGLAVVLVLTCSSDGRFYTQAPITPLPMTQFSAPSTISNGVPHPIPGRSPYAKIEPPLYRGYTDSPTSMTSEPADSSWAYLALAAAAGVVLSRSFTGAKSQAADLEAGPTALQLAGQNTAMLAVFGTQKPKKPARSEALPWANRPESLEESDFVGDSGFDPLGLFGADPWKAGWDRQFYREAEIKHGRLAMLCALAFPVQERVEPMLAKALNLPDELAATAGRSPSLVNGGLDQGEIPLTLLAFLVGGSAVEYLISQRKKAEGAKYVLGDVGFDPLKLYGATAEEQRGKELLELRLGRAAMAAVLCYVLEEASGATLGQATGALLQELGNFRALELDLAKDVSGIEKGASAVLNEVGNLEKLELDVSGFSRQVTESVAEGAGMLREDLTTAPAKVL